MKKYLIATLVTGSLVSGVSFAQGASGNAPGKQKMDGQSAKQYAPGQQMDKGKGKSGDSAKSYAPGQQSKDGDRPMMDRMQDGAKGGGNTPGKGKN